MIHWVQLLNVQRFKSKETVDSQRAWGWIRMKCAMQSLQTTQKRDAIFWWEWVQCVVELVPWW